MADENGGGFTGLFKEHPVIMVVSVVAVALIAWLASRSNSSGAGSAVIVQPANDPNASTNAAAIAQANIAAGAANISTGASLIGAESTNAAALRSSLATSEAARQVGLSQIEASLLASEHSDNAQVAISNAQTAAALEAQRITAAAMTAANVGTNTAVNNTPVMQAGGFTLQGSGSNLGAPGSSIDPSNPDAAAAQAAGAAWAQNISDQIRQKQQDSTNLAKKIFTWALSYL
jgi:hypothetical protein